ncbi:MAG: 4Fe-4S binding protein [Thermoleophilia bacterium]|nr:4Fe-4S binding protein [Thermoleophilia bacterium]
MALAIDETRCVRCGLCITECPAGAFRGEGSYTVGQSVVYEKIELDNEKCTNCGQCTAYQFWCPAEAIYEPPADTTPFGTPVGKGNVTDGTKYSKLFYQYQPGDDPYIDIVGKDMPFSFVTRFDSNRFPIPGSNFYYVHWIMPHDEPFLEIGHPPHIHRSPELLFHIGGDPENPQELYSEVEFYMGVEMERHVFNKSTVIYIPPNVIHSPWRPRYTKKPWLFIEVNQGPSHTEKGYHQILKPEQWSSRDLLRPAFADEGY